MQCNKPKPKTNITNVQWIVLVIFCWGDTGGNQAKILHPGSYGSNYTKITKVGKVICFQHSKGKNLNVKIAASCFWKS